MAITAKDYIGSDEGKPVTVYPSWAEGYGQLWIGSKHIELTKTATQALRDELDELLRNW